MRERHAQEWDRQIEEDAQSGKLRQIPAESIFTLWAKATGGGCMGAPTEARPSHQLDPYGAFPQVEPSIDCITAPPRPSRCSGSSSLLKIAPASSWILILPRHA